MRKQSDGAYDPNPPISVRGAAAAGEPIMTEDNKDASRKWGDPTSSYEDAMAIKKKLIEKLKDQKAKDQKEGDKRSS